VVQRLRHGPLRARQGEVLVQMNKDCGTGFCEHGRAQDIPTPKSNAQANSHDSVFNVQRPVFFRASETNCNAESVCRKSVGRCVCGVFF
jgi:hypothetical protein